MSISEEFARLQELHESGTLTEAEFAEAKSKVLVGEPPASQIDIQRLQIQNEILRLDQDWAEERDDYMLHGRYGTRSIPTTGSAVGGAVMFSILGFICIVLASAATGSRAGNGWFLAFMMFAIAAYIGISGLLKANAYNAAYESYQRRRAELTDQLEALR